MSRRQNHHSNKMRGIASAEHRQCPKCGRKAALGAPVVMPDGRARKCRYCGHECGVISGNPFGYSVSP